MSVILEELRICCNVHQPGFSLLQQPCFQSESRDGSLPPLIQNLTDLDQFKNQFQTWVTHGLLKFTYRFPCVGRAFYKVTHTFRSAGDRIPNPNPNPNPNPRTTLIVGILQWEWGGSSKSVQLAVMT